MNKELLRYCEKEIQDLLDKKSIRKSKSLWSCSTFYVQKQVELERWTPRLVINYKSLNDALRWIRYPIPNKKDLLQRLVKSKIFSKFDMKSRFWQIQIAKKDRYKIAFVVPSRYYEWIRNINTPKNIYISILGNGREKKRYHMQFYLFFIIFFLKFLYVFPLFLKTSKNNFYLSFKNYSLFSFVSKNWK